MALVELPELRDRVGVFRDRAHAGEVLAGMLVGRSGMVLAVPAGGVPVAAVVAARLGLPLDVAVVSKVTLPWTTEAGYGAVAFDGVVRLNQAFIAAVGLGSEEVQRGVDQATAKVRRRMAALRPGRGPLELEGRELILVDDGLASGFTMELAVEAVRRAGAVAVTVAVPTAPVATATRLATLADQVVCANLRHGPRFAVADAYRAWHDVEESEALALLTAAAG